MYNLACCLRNVGVAEQIVNTWVYIFIILKIGIKSSENYLSSKNTSCTCTVDPGKYINILQSIMYR